MGMADIGNRCVQRLLPCYPALSSRLSRTRFKAIAVELEWALLGSSNNDPGSYLVHLGQARDIGVA